MSLSTLGPTAEISVIVVNYGTADLAIEAVESVLARDHGGRPVDIHLVDNASPGSDADILETALQRPGWTERVFFYPESENHGFGRGNNLVLTALAARTVPPKYVFLLNPDARLENEAVGILADFLDSHTDVAVAGASIRKPGDVPVTAAFRFPGVISEFIGALSIGPVTRACARWQVPLDPYLPTGTVGWVAGAAMMARLSALRQVGLFDPDYFLYYEEVDLMYRLKQAGFETWYVAEARAIHLEGAATDVKSGRSERRRRPAYWYESWRFYFVKNHGRVRALAAAAAWVLGAVLNHGVERLRGRTPKAPLQFLSDFWSVGIRPMLGLKGRRND